MKDSKDLKVKNDSTVGPDKIVNGVLVEGSKEEKETPIVVDHNKTHFYRNLTRSKVCIGMLTLEPAGTQGDTLEFSHKMYTEDFIDGVKNLVKMKLNNAVDLKLIAKV